MQCTPPLEFNARTKNCDWKHSAGCTPGTGSDDIISEIESEAVGSIGSSTGTGSEVIDSDSEGAGTTIGSGIIGSGTDDSLGSIDSGVTGISGSYSSNTTEETLGSAISQAGSFVPSFGKSHFPQLYIRTTYYSRRSQCAPIYIYSFVFFGELIMWLICISSS